MSEATQTVEAQDPFQGQEPTFEEFSKFRESGEVPERFKPAPVPPAATQEEAKPAEEKGTSEAEQEQEQERSEDGKFKAKKEPLLTQEQFDRAFRKREGKLRREYDEKIAALESKLQQVQAPAKKPPTNAATSEPREPELELPDLETFTGTFEEYKQVIRERTQQHAEKVAEFRETRRKNEETKKGLIKKLEKSAKELMKEYPDFEDVDTAFKQDIQNGEEVSMPQHLFDAIVQDTDDPQRIMYHLQTNRDEYRRLTELSPNLAAKEIHRLEFKFQQDKVKSNAAPAQEPKPRQTSAPPPPETVGARATAKAFDVNDETLSADEWAKKRNEQVYKRR